MISRREFVKSAAAGTLTASAMGAAGAPLEAAVPTDDSGKSSAARRNPDSYRVSQDARRTRIAIPQSCNEWVQADRNPHAGREDSAPCFGNAG